ncbi:hypothetical protein HAY47_004430 [Salmonella enterica]|nr:hypothetical protein [Salmonella enterica]HCM1853082.1 hypothetical protein [Salmonella enterica subsp. salamae serovar 42:z29:-]EAY8297370.1 hypothetical protein [Salmonella enterica]EAY8607338.1 hypothetical protein [Salmonella enterica]EEP0974733.1 hypothetical protein [Salmonella enterica]
MKRKTNISIYILALSFSSFIAVLCSSIIYKISLLLCEITLGENRECIISSTDGFYYTIIFLLSFVIYRMLFSQLQKKASRSTENVISHFCWLFFCFLSGIGLALLMLAFLYYLFPIDSWLTKIHQYVHNHWGWFPGEEEGNPIEGIIACISVFLCPLLFTFAFYRMLKRIIRLLKWQHKKENP